MASLPILGKCFITTLWMINIMLWVNDVVSITKHDGRKKVWRPCYQTIVARYLYMQNKNVYSDKVKDISDTKTTVFLLLLWTILKQNKCMLKSKYYAKLSNALLCIFQLLCVFSHYTYHHYTYNCFGGVFMLSCCFLDLSVGVGAFVIGLSQISSFFSYDKTVFSYTGWTVKCTKGV